MRGNVFLLGVLFLLLYLFFLLWGILAGRGLETASAMPKLRNLFLFNGSRDPRVLIERAGNPELAFVSGC